MVKTLRHGLFAVTLAVGVAADGSAQSFLTEDGAYDCLIEPHVVVDVGSPVDGIVAEVAVDRGDIVKAGQVIARLEWDVELATVDLARARAENNAQIDLRREAMEFETRKHARAQSLSKDKVVSDAAVDEARTNSRLADMQLGAARLEKRIAELELNRAVAFLNQRTIKSPINGIVVRRNEFIGERLNEQATVMTVAQLDPLNVEVFVPVELYGQVREGTSATVTPQAPIGGSYDAEVRVVDRVFDAASGTFGVRLSLANPELSLPAGIRCRVRFALDDEARPAGDPAPQAAPDLSRRR